MQLNVRWRRAPASLQATHPLGYNEDTLNHETGGCARFQREKKIEGEEDSFHGCSRFSNSMYHPIVSRIFFIISLRTGDVETQTFQETRASCRVVALQFSLREKGMLRLTGMSFNESRPGIGSCHLEDAPTARAALGDIQGRAEGQLRPAR